MFNKMVINNSGKIHIKKDIWTTIYYFFLIFPHTISVPYLQRLSGIGDFIDICRILSFSLITITVIIKRKFSVITILICIAEIYMLIITYLHQADVDKCLKAIFPIICIALIYEVAIRENAKSFLSAQLLCFEVVIYINLFTEVLYPNGLYIGVSSDTYFVSAFNWFLGYYNNHSIYYIPALLISWLYKYCSGKSVRTLLLTEVIFLSSVLVWSGGVLLSLMSIVLCYLFIKNYNKIMNYFTCWLLQILLFFLIYTIKLQNMFKWLIDDFLGKWRSMNSRMALWENAIYYIKLHPWFGYGVESGIVRENKIGNYAAVHAHNFLLETLYQGGIIYLLIFVTIVCIAGYSVIKNQNKEVGRIITCVFWGWNIHLLVEPFTTPFLMGMFIVAFYCEKFSPDLFKANVIDGH